MNIIVCIKQVPETTEVKIDPVTKTLIRDKVKSIVNPFDMYAVEEAIRLKEKHGGKTTALTMGPPQASNALKETISMGIDEAILLSDRFFAGSDTYATSLTLSKAIAKIGSYDIILCGKQATDGDTAQVGPGISAHLNIPQITYVKKIEQIENGKIRVQRMTEEGYEVVETTLPVLLTVVKEINIPRYATIRGKIKANKYEVPRWTHAELNMDPNDTGLKGSPTCVVKTFTPPPRQGGKIFKGEASQIADELAGLLKGEIK